MDSSSGHRKHTGPPAGHMPQPTAREGQVLQLLAEDHRRESVAVLLGITRSAVDPHLASLRRKAGVRYNHGLVYRALGLGWLLPPDRTTDAPSLRYPAGELHRTLLLLADDHGEKQIADRLFIPCCRNIERFLHDLRVLAEVDTSPGLVYRAVVLGWLPMPGGGG